MGLKCREEILKITPYVPGKPIGEVQRELGLKDIIKLASNENPLGPSKRVREALREYVGQAHMYPDGNATNLKALIAKELDVLPEQILIGNGSDEILKLIGEAYLNPGDEVIISESTFSEYQFVARLMGATEVLIPLKEYTYDLEAFQEAITPKTKIIFVCNPNNPTGTMVEREAFDRFIASVPEGILIVVDEAYYEYAKGPTYPDSLQWVRNERNVIVTRTFSKIHGLAGLRIGYGISTPAIIRDIARTKEPFNVNSFAQLAAEVSFLDRDHVQASYDLNEEGKAYLTAELGELGFSVIPTFGNFIMAETKRDSRKLFTAMLKRGVIIRSGDIFNLPTHIRITIGTMEENRRFVSALREVLAGEDCN